MNNRERQNSYGVYLQDQVDVTGRLKVRFGGRYDRFNQDIRDYLGHTDVGQSPTAFSPQVGVSYDVARPLTVWTRFSRRERTAAW
ncbi:TonB-dependent receptor domain-containing protein [Sphingomonas bacterium]|uniref:TonB-dependent receptor domain-containing protein n=1 Tax=Sphingomonas bacterium TaxID=1895847 RepID=UPI00267076B8|nr:TonB-dependent receptor [Sphingomonas bacterium]